jgi:hypothetical protein
MVPARDSLCPDHLHIDLNDESKEAKMLPIAATMVRESMRRQYAPPVGRRTRP